MSLLILQTTPLKKWIFTSKIANEQTYILTYQTTKKPINPPKFNQQQKSHDLPILRPNDAVSSLCAVSLQDIGDHDFPQLPVCHSS